MPTVLTSSKRAVIDTNVLIYAHDRSDPVKQAVSVSLIKELIDNNALTVSVQILNEFYVVATRPNKPPSLLHAEAVKIVQTVAAAATVLPLTQATSILAFNGVERYHISFWDALVWAVAKENEIPLIYTEDVPSSSVIESVHFINPFAGPTTSAFPM